MARCEIKLPDELYEAFTKLGNKTDEILKSTLEAGGKVILSTAKTDLSRAVTNSSNRSTG